MTSTEIDVVISGISGRFPESDNVKEFMDNLYSHKDMITEDDRRWPMGYLGLPRGNGRIKDITRFDAQFFGTPDSEAHQMDPQIRIMLELTYEAIWDAGIDPNSLCGSNTGAFIGNYNSEMPGAVAENYTKATGFQQLFAGRIAQVFNWCGPSMVYDTACAGSFSALHEAVYALRNNICDQAVVVGVNISLNATINLQFFNLNMLSPDGHCKCLDRDANGYAKGEACAVVFLQKKSAAKRIYATIVHIKTNSDGYKDMGITYPSSDSQSRLIRLTYEEANINPHDVKYMEAHCTGTPAGDPIEMTSIVNAMCTGRGEPLLIGAVKSNIGHTEATSGLCSLTKVIFSLENQCIPANLHMETPNPKIEGLLSGILKPITENTAFKEKLVGINCFGFGGVNVNLIVRGDSKEASPHNQDIFGGIPRLVLMCGRNEGALKYFFGELLKSPEYLSQDYLSLVNDISKTSAFNNESTGYQAMSCRGFALIENSVVSSDSLPEIRSSDISNISEGRRQVWYVFSGMGSQWPAMAQPLMCLEAFAQSIQRSAQILIEYNYNLMDVLLEEKEQPIDCPLNAFISLIAVQIALVDVLSELDVSPDGIVGHSVGEVVGAYADGCLTQEEAIRMTYWGGHIIKDEIKTIGRMAAIGLGLDELQRRLPSDVFIACYNSDDSFTVSGSETAVSSFVSRLSSEGVFVRPVNSCGIAFHSPLMIKIRQNLNKKLSEVMSTKRLRSSKWLSTTYDQSDDRSRYVCSEYFADNLVNPVLFNDALKQVPRDAIMIEVSAHPLLQSVVKRSLGSDITYIPLLMKNKDIHFFLESVGRLYSCGINPKIESFYPRVEYPVSRGTPALSPLVKWDHSQSYSVYQYPDYFNPIGNTDTVLKVDLQDKEHQYLSGHCIDGRTLFPATAYLLMAWKQLAKQLGVSYEELPIEFKNVCLHRATILPKVGDTKFTVKILETSGHFVITESGTVVVTGSLFVAKGLSNQFEYLLEEGAEDKGCFVGNNSEVVLKYKDIYKELRLRGYDYGKTFQCLSKAVVNDQGVRAAVKWTNWVSFTDSVIQMSILGKRSSGLYLPVRIDYLRCDPRQLPAQNGIDYSSGSLKLPSLFDAYLGISVSKGLELRGVKTNLAPRKVFSRMPLVEQYSFVPYDEEECRINTSDKHFLHQYLRQCNAMALNLMDKFDVSSKENSRKVDFLINYCDSGNESEDSRLLTLFKSLDCIENNEKMFEDFRQNVSALDNDLLNRSFLREEVLRQQLETVIENLRFTDNRINVLEVSQSQAIVAQNVIQMIGSSALDMKISYSLLHPMMENLSTGMLKDLDCFQWKVEESALPPEQNNFDLILYEDRIDLITGEFPINLTVLFDSLWNSVKDNGFLIVINKIGFNFAEEVVMNISDQLQSKTTKNKLAKEVLARKNKIIYEARKVGFSLIGTKVDRISNKSSMIFRKVCAVLHLKDQTFIQITNDNCQQWIGKLQSELKTIESRPKAENIWLLGDDCPTNGIIGFVKCLRKEPNGHRIRCIFQSGGNGSDKNQLVFKQDQLENIVKNDLVMNIIKPGKGVGSFTHLTIDLKDNSVPSEHCYLNIQTKGDLSSFKWFEAQHKYWPLGKKSNQQLINVYYAPLNFRDVMLATGKLPADALPDDQGSHECLLGLEFAGRDQNRNRVMGMTPFKAMATTIVIKETDFVWPIPDHWSMEEASTVPVVYATAYYALIVRGKLNHRETVLIHSGSGGVGQAAIAICLSMDCQLFITCGSNEKREFLKKMFSPKLKDKNFWTSRDSSFETFVMRETGGQGVDVVLNSLSEDKLQASVRCLAPNGRFLEIGKYDLSQNNNLDISNLLRNKTFHGVLLDCLLGDDSKCTAQLLAHKRDVRHLIENGIRDGTVRPLKTTVYDSTHVEEAFRFMASGKHIGKVVLKLRDETVELLKLPAVPRTVFKPNRSYVIIGGLGGFGLELANWMIERGAMNLVLTSRSGLTTPYQRRRVKGFKELGIHIEISTKDVSDLSEAQDLIKGGAHVGSAQGVGGIFNLAMVLSDALFENQTSEQFARVMAPKALAVKHLDQLSRELCPELDYFVCFSSVSCGRGNSGQTNYGLANSVMERVCEERRESRLPGLAVQWGPIGDVGVIAENGGTNDVVLCGALPQRMPSCLATLDSLLQMEYPVVSSVVKADHKVEASTKKGDLIKTIADILGLKEYMNLNPNQTLGELGMDSLMSVEVKQTLEREYDLVLSADEIRRLSVGRIVAIDQKNDSKP